VAGGPTVPPDQWGQGPLMPHSIAETWYMKTAHGGDRTSFYVEDYEAGARKPKKERTFFGISLGGGLASILFGDSRMRKQVGDANVEQIRKDDWRRDQGGGQRIIGGRWGQATDWAPGPPGGFVEVPQVRIYGTPGGYYDGQGYWHDA
jgi:hypothetical protein